MNKFLIYLLILMLVFNFGFVSYVYATSDLPFVLDNVTDVVDHKEYFLNCNSYRIKFRNNSTGNIMYLSSFNPFYYSDKNFRSDYPNNTDYDHNLYYWAIHGDYHLWFVYRFTSTNYLDSKFLTNNTILSANFDFQVDGESFGGPIEFDEPDSFVYDFDLKEGAIFDIKKPPVCSLEVKFSSVGSLSFKRSQVFGSEYFNPTNWDLIMEEVVTTDSIINLNDGITRFKITDVVNPEAVRLKAIACPNESFPQDPDNPGSVISPPGLGPYEYVTRNIPEGKSIILDNFTNNALPITVNYKPKSLIASGALYVSWHTNYLDEWVVYNDTAFGGPKSITKNVPVLKGDRIIFSNQSGSSSITYPDKTGIEYTIVDDVYIYNPMDPSTDSDKIDDNWSPGTIDNPNYNNNPYGPGGNIADFELGDFNRSMLDSFGAVQDMSGNVFTYFATGLSWIPKEWLLLGTLSLTIGLLAFIFGRK